MLQCSMDEFHNFVTLFLNVTELMNPKCTFATLSQGSNHPLYVSIMGSVDKLLIQTTNTFHCFCHQANHLADLYS